jgi:hypothetical protein
MEIELSNLPADVSALALKGDMTNLFKLLYKKCGNFSNNNINSNSNDEVCQLTIIMPTGERLLFEITSIGMKLIPGGEIEMDVGEKPGDIYLAHVKKTNRISGKVATNYAITIASLLGAKTLSISDSAYIKCNDGIKTFPLSLYRILTMPGEPTVGWYENVAKVKGYSANNRLALKLGFVGAVNSAREIRTDEIKNYLEKVKLLLETNDIIKQKHFVLDFKGKLLEHEAGVVEDKYKKPIIDIIDIIIKSLSLSKTATLAGFLNEPDRSCTEKALILRSLPGFNSHIISVPMTLCDKDNTVILEFPNLRDFLIIKTVTLGYKIKLKGGKTNRKNINGFYTRKN